MKQFLKDNITIVAAIALPLLLVLVFALSSAVTSAVVEDPQHDFLIATQYSHNDTDALRFDVVQDRLVVTYRPPVQTDNQYNNMYTNTPRLWRVHVTDMAVEEIAIPLPPREQGTQQITLPGVSNLKLVNRQPGPDGYTFEPWSRHYHGNFMTEIFSATHTESRAAIVKKGRVIPVRGLQEPYYNYNTHLIGWILDAE